jgi:hypothetical protein
MTRTKPAHLVLLAVLGGGLAWLLEVALTAGGRAIVIPPVTLSVALFAIGVIVVLMALPVRRATRGTSTKRIDPFYAARTAMLAKASSLSGALMGGAGLGIAFYLLSRSVPAVGSVTLALATAGGAILLLVAGLVAEHMCTIPPDDSSPDGTPNHGGHS